METFPINWWAVLVAGVVKIALGAFWYSPIAFLPRWMALAGITDAQMKAGFAKALTVDVIGAFIMAFVLLHAVHYAGAHTIAQGAAVGFFNWIGFIAVVLLSQVLYEHRPFALFLVNNGYLLLSLLIMGAIFAVWP